MAESTTTASPAQSDYSHIVIKSIKAYDIRFPTSKTSEGTDAVHTNCNYSAAHVNLRVESTRGNSDNLPTGYGIIFTIGKGNELCCKAVSLLAEILVGRTFQDVLDNFSLYFNKLTNEPQLRWVGPEKGVVHLSVAGIINAIWDLYGKLENKPLWKLLSDLTPERLVSMLNFKYVEDVLTPEEALQILRESWPHRAEREKLLLERGYPAYTTGCAWSGYSDEKVAALCQSALDRGFQAFKVKVGLGVEADKKRLELMRRCIGDKPVLMVDSNQVWTVKEAVDTMKQLAQYNLFWIEEPTCPDDAYGHSLIAKELNPLGIRVATGEHLQNRVVHKHFNVLNGYQICQLDSVRLAGVNEAVLVMIMAKKFNKPVCTHAGGVGLCEMVVHISVFDYIGISGALDERYCEYCDALHEHFKTPVEIKNGAYVLPQAPGYASDMKEESLAEYSYPYGAFWREELQLNQAPAKNLALPNFKPATGIYVATLTPYKDANGAELNLDLIEPYSELLVAQGVSGLFINGTSGESVSLTTDERKRITEAWMATRAVKDGKLIPIVHAGCESYPDTVELVKHAASVGAQGIAIMSPSFFKPRNAKELGEVIAAVARHVPNTPFYYYHFPGMNTLNYPVIDTLTHAHSIAPNVIGCKYTATDCGDMGLITSAGFTVLIGQDQMLLSGLAAGVQGAIGIGYSFAGRLHQDIYDLFRQGEIEAAQQKQQKSRLLMDWFARNQLGASVRTVMKEWFNLDFGPLRWPQRVHTEQEAKVFIEGLKQFDREEMYGRFWKKN